MTLLQTSWHLLESGGLSEPVCQPLTQHTFSLARSLVLSPLSPSPLPPISLPCSLFPLPISPHSPSLISWTRTHLDTQRRSSEMDPREAEHRVLHTSHSN